MKLSCHITHLFYIVVQIIYHVISYHVILYMKLSCIVILHIHFIRSYIYIYISCHILYEVILSYYIFSNLVLYIYIYIMLWHILYEVILSCHIHFILSCLAGEMDRQMGMLETKAVAVVLLCLISALPCLALPCLFVSCLALPALA
jgi:hypothetical protein